MLDWQLDNLLNFLDLLLETTDLVVGRVWNLLDLHEANKWILLVRHDHVELLALMVLQSDTCVRHQILHIDAAINLNNVFAVIGLDEALALAHHFADLTDGGRALKELVQLLLQVLHLGVHLVALGFKAPEVVLLLDETHLHLRDLLEVVGLKPCLLLGFNERLGTLQDQTVVFDHSYFKIFG